LRRRLSGGREIYLHHELREVTEHRQSEALVRIGTLHRLMAASPAFLGAMSCRYGGRLDQYAWFRLWRSTEEQTAFRQTEPAKEFGQTRPEGLYQQLPDAIAPGLNWESVIDHGPPQGGSFLVRSVFRVGPGREREFIERRQALDERALADLALDWSATFQSSDAGSGDLFLTLARAPDRETYNRFLESPTATKYREELPAGLYERLADECYLIVDEVNRPEE
jgi:hypothetical protein